MNHERVVVNIADMKHPETNVRMHPERQIKELMRSLEKFGQCRDIVIDENNVILAGNGLKEAMERRGDTTASALRLTGLSEKEKFKFMLADNKTFTLGIEDHEGINAVLEMLGDEFDVPGYDEETLKAIVASSSDIADKLMGYGSLTEQEINSIKAAGERMENAQSLNTAQNQTHNASQGAAEATNTAETRRSVVCPHCNETIWL